MSLLTSRPWLTALASFGVAAVSCLPKDTRPEPGSILVTITGAALLLAGERSVTSADGWRIAFDRFLLVAGELSLEGDLCASYYDADYRRIVDLQVAGPQKLGQVYGLGPCDVSLEVNDPLPSTLLGRGVSETDRAFMELHDSDDYIVDRATSVYARGRATKGTVTKTFAWAFRTPVGYTGCNPLPGDRTGEAFALTGGSAQSLELEVHGEALFADGSDSTLAKLWFEPFAAADDRYGNADGEITLSELNLVPLAEIGLATSSRDGGVLIRLGTASDAGLDGALSLADGGPYATQPGDTLERYVYLEQLDNVLHVGKDEGCGRVFVEGAP